MAIFRSAAATLLGYLICRLPFAFDRFKESINRPAHNGFHHVIRFE